MKTKHYYEVQKRSLLPATRKWHRSFMGNPYGQSGRWLSSIADATAYAQHARKNFCNLEYRIVRLSKDADVSTGLFARVSRVIRQWKAITR